MKRYFDIGEEIFRDGEIIKIEREHSSGVYDCAVYEITEDDDIVYNRDQYFTVSELRTIERQNNF